jgi:hypothetical protein
LSIRVRVKPKLRSATITNFSIVTAKFQERNRLRMLIMSEIIPKDLLKDS